MKMPPPSDPLWSDIVTGRRKVAFDFLAARMLVTRLQITAMKDKSPQTITQLANQLHALFETNSSLPTARKDMEKLGF